MPATLKLANRLVETACRVGLALGALATAGILVLLVGSSLLRYVSGAPMPYTEELAALLFVVTSLAAVPFAVVSNQHIRLLVVWRKLPQPAASWFAFLGDLLGVIVLWIMIRQMIAFAEYSRQAGSRSEVGEILLWPWMYFMPAALGLLALAMLLRASTRLLALRQGKYTSLEAGTSVD